MIDAADLRSGLALVGLREEDVPHVVAAGDRSRERIETARSILQGIEPSAGAPIALGSHGRHEASTASDLDLAYLFDPADSTEQDAARDRAACVHALREAGFEVPEKTFRRPIAVPGLVANVGGPLDTHEHLTHRALILTESAWLRDREKARSAWMRIFALYRDGLTRGKYMTSLLNDLHRYYRTVCLDYRHKIEEAEKGWALRYLKLRHSRKTLHLSNLVLHCAARALARGEGFDAYLAASLGDPPLLKMAGSLAALGDASICAGLWRRYDAFLAHLEDPATRAELEALRPADETSSAAFRELKDNARRLDDDAEQVVQVLLDDPRTRHHLLRFGLL